MFPIRAIQNILLRRSLLYGLNVIVPKRGQNQIFTGGMIPFNSSWLDDQVPWHKTYMRESMYDIMALHCMWNHPVIRYYKNTQPNPISSISLKNGQSKFGRKP